MKIWVRKKRVDVSKEKACMVVLASSGLLALNWGVL